jgi:hypothetical protein
MAVVVYAVGRPKAFGTFSMPSSERSLAGVERITGWGLGAPSIEARALHDHLAPLGRAGAVMVDTCDASQAIMGVITWLHVTTHNQILPGRVGKWVSGW